MVSKTIVICLAVLASISAIQATTVQEAGFGYCVGGYTYFNKVYSLGIDLTALLGGVLGLVSNVVSGLLGLLFGGSGTIAYVNVPRTLGALVETNIKVAPIFGSLCAKQFDSFWKANIFADVYLALTLELFTKLNLNIGAYPFLNAAISLGDCRERVRPISAYLRSCKYQTGPLAQLAVLTNDFLSIVNTTNITVDVYVSAMIKFIKIQIALYIMDGGYRYVPQYRDTLIQTCNSVFRKTSGFETKVIVAADLAVNVPSKCGCLRK